MNKDSYYVTKSSGEKSPFSYEKLKRSLLLAGATEETSESILKEVERSLYEGIPTKVIYSKAFKLLKNKPGALAARYKLKHAIMELGPSGFPFENFLGEVFKSHGHSVEVGRTVQGHCVSHEIDVIALKDEFHHYIECKFHNNPGYACDVKVPLYIHSRFNDVERALRKLDENKRNIYQGWVVTNTRFTKDALLYGTCSGLRLLSWSYPEKEGLKELIESSGVQPITSLTTLHKIEKQALLNKKIVLCKEVYNSAFLLKEVGVADKRTKGILKEIELLSSTSNLKMRV